MAHWRYEPQAQAAFRSPSICLNQAPIWFQLVKIWVTTDFEPLGAPLNFFVRRCR
jgi:hypothetical protein